MERIKMRQIAVRRNTVIVRRRIVFIRSSTTLLLSLVLCCCFHWVNGLSSSTDDNCRMELWVYEELESCEAVQSPSAKGVLYADGTCRATIKGSDETTPSSSALLPGTYRAICTPDGSKLLFLDSGCLDDQCTGSNGGATVQVSSSSNDEIDVQQCDMDDTTVASLYARGEPSEYRIQNSTDGLAGFFACSRIRSNTKLQVTYVILGDCANPSCIVAMDHYYNRNSTDTTPNETDTSNDVETSAPTSPAPSVASDPTIQPTRSRKGISTVAPTPVPSTLLPSTTTPTAGPIALSIPPTATIPTEVPIVQSIPPTITAIVRPVHTETIQVGMILTSINDGLISEDAEIIWERTTTLHITNSVQKEHGGDTTSTIPTILISPIQQEELNPEDDSDSITYTKTVASLPPNRMLLLSSDIATKSVRIYFNMTCIYNGTSSLKGDDTSLLSAERIFNEAFDTESERTRYIIDIVNTKEPTFANVTKIQIISNSTTSTMSPTSSSTIVERTNPQPVPLPASPTNTTTNTTTSTTDSVVSDPTSNQNSSSSNKNGKKLFLIIISSCLGTILILSICGYYLYQRGKKDAIKNSASATSTASHTTNTIQNNNNSNDKAPSCTSSSSLSPNRLAQSPTQFAQDLLVEQQQQQYEREQQQEQQLWTNEIIIDRTQDDVSTLGDSVIHSAGFGHDSNNNVTPVNQRYDEPTASVHHDFDFVKNRYKTSGGVGENDYDDGNLTRSTANNLTQYTSFTRLNMGHETILMDDRKNSNDIGNVMVDDNTINNDMDDASFEQQYYNDGDFEKNHRSRILKNNVGTTSPATLTSKAIPGATPNTYFTSPSPDRSKISTTPSSSSTLHKNHRQEQPMMSSLPPPSSPQSFYRNKQQEVPVQLRQEQPQQGIRFEVRVPPGLLGMVIDTPNGSVPVVRAIKDTSILFGKVRIHDELILVDNIDVTSLSAIKVSNIISSKSHLHRTLMFLRRQ